MDDFNRILSKLVSRKDLLDDEIVYAIDSILEGKLTEGPIAAFLIALRMKGETARELNMVIQTIRGYMTKITPKIKGYLIDTCGTGGSQINTFNISTASAIIASSVGVKVAKHGNRSASGVCGSADFMEHIGINLDCPISQVIEAIQVTGLGFLYAPKFHPTMRNVSAARRSIGVRTVFNMIGPLTNPCTNLSGQLIGVPEPKLIETLVPALNHSELTDIMLVNPEDGLDELSTTCNNDIIWIKDKQVNRFRLNPREIGLEPARVENLIVHSKEGSIRDTLKVIYGVSDKEKQDIAILNASAALVIGKAAASFKEGIELARDAIKDGRAQKQLERYARRCGQPQILSSSVKEFL